MLKKLLLCTLTATLAASFAAWADIKPSSDPIRITEPNWLTIDTEFELKSSGQNIGKITRKMIQCDVEYKFFDADNQLEATALLDRRCCQFGMFNVHNAADQFLGRVKTKCYIFRPWYEILSKNKEVVAVCQSNFLGTKFTIKDSQTQQVIAELKRPFPWNALARRWSCHIIDADLLAKKQISMPLIYLAAVYTSDSAKITCLTAGFRSLGRALGPIDSNENAFEPFKPYLAKYKKLSLNEVDFEKAAAAFEKKISKASKAKKKNKKKDDDSTEIEKVTTVAAQMLEENELTPKQKYALVKLLEEKLVPPTDEIK